MKPLLPIIAGLALLAAGALPAGAEEELVAVYHAQGVPVEPDAKVWQEAPQFKIDLVPQNFVAPMGGGAVTRLAVQAVHDGQWLALRLEWPDATANREVGTSSFRDAVAVGFPVTEGETPPSPFMGDPDRPVDIWQWTADFDANARGQGGFADRYPHTEGVWYFPQDYEVTRQVRGWRGFEPVIELTARGFGTLERKVGQNVRGKGRHSDSGWAVVLRRQLATGNPRDPLFRPGQAVSIIFAVWDGGNGDVNGRKSVTIKWRPFRLRPTKDKQS